MVAEPINVNSQMKQIADNAVTAARDKFGVTLDFTENSLEQLEVLLQQAHQGYKSASSSGNSPNTPIENTVRVWGSYFGEVIRRSLGGDWIASQKEVILQLGSRRLDPLGQVRCRIVEGQQNNLQRYFQELLYESKNILDANPKSNELKKNYLQTSSVGKKNRNSSTFYVVGIFGIFVLVSFCVLGIWFLEQQGFLTNITSKDISVPSTTQVVSLPTTPIFTSTIQSTITISPTPRDTNTPLPTNTHLPTNTAIITSTPFPSSTPTNTLTNTPQPGIGDLVLCGNVFTAIVPDQPIFVSSASGEKANGMYLIVTLQLVNITTQPVQIWMNDYLVEGVLDGRTITFSLDQDATIGLYSDYGLSLYQELINPSLTWKTMLAFDVNPDGIDWVLILKPGSSISNHQVCEVRLPLTR
jgi:hypothetical protein